MSVKCADANVRRNAQSEWNETPKANETTRSRTG